MKKKIFILTLLAFTIFGNAQQIETSYVRGKNSTFCGEEKFTLKFEGNYFERKDNSDGSLVYGPSKKTDSGYDDSGIYYEIRTPIFALEEKGITEYNRYSHYSHRIGYDKKGGSVLYVYEINNDRSGDGKFYLTELGYTKICK
jgi:hypothetical protein